MATIPHRLSAAALPRPRPAASSRALAGGALVLAGVGLAPRGGSMSRQVEREERA